ncbi:MAG: type II toxin-antitoxin system HicB family antitoxin [Chloroflexi bacterium]|nr:MAG: type II toxin-antitoxin system HicB family antitoxin [Chloroflexota bacterium]
MHAYTIVVQPAEDEGHIAVVPDLPGWTATAQTVEECVARAREVIGLVAGELAPGPGPTELTGGGGGATDQAEEEALDALRRAMAALRTVESHLEDEITRTPDGRARRPLRRAHGALLRARRSLGEEERRTLDRVLDPATV